MSHQVKRVRIIVRDDHGAVLLICWQDPVNGRRFWEPPGGGIEGDETPLEAAHRELYEETGLVLELDGPPVRVHRAYEWAGKAYDHDELFFPATSESTTVALTAPTPREIATLVAMRFVPCDGIGALAEPLEPPNLLDVLGEIA